MAILELPVTNNTDKTYRFTLSGQDYDVRLRYLSRLTNVANGKNIKADEWIISIALTGTTPVINSSLKTNRNILEMHRYKSSCPAGTLFLRDELADRERAIEDGYDYSPERVTLEGMGDRWKLIYIE